MAGDCADATDSARESAAGVTVLLVSLGAMIGAPARYLTDRWVQVRFGSSFPWGTLAVNVFASFVIGIVLGAGTGVDGPMRALIGTGFCGALSTYSTFSFEAMRLHQRGTRLQAYGYVALTLTAGITAAAAGWAIGAVLS